MQSATKRLAWRLPLLAALLAVMALLGVRPGPLAAGEPLLASWVALGPEGRVIARAITAAPSCPAIAIDGRSSVMSERAAPAPDYPVRVCESDLPRAAQRAAIEGEPLPLPKADIPRIVVIGDTGCRMAQSSSGGSFQACNDPEAWPFARLAGRAAAEPPDLVIHVGDYHYREAPCPEGNAGCAGSTWGQNWASWRADFFAPAAPLLRAAPWVFVRGNHEDCMRAGEGWFRFLDPRPMAKGCEDYTEPYAVPIGDVRLLMLDSSLADDYMVIPEQVAEYRRQLTLLRDLAGDAAWLLTHDPLRVFGHAGEQNGVEQLFRDNENLQEAARGVLPPGLSLVLSGHIHLFQALDFVGDEPAQLVVGNSGTTLDPQVTSLLAGLEIGGATVRAGTSLSQFGYVTIERDGARWTATLRTLDGPPLVICELRGRQLACR
jgi:hypothetical protein